MINQHDKNSIRKEYLSKRNMLNETEVDSLSRLICNKLISSTEFKACNKICLYYPIKNEVDVRLCLKSCYDSGIEVYLPRVEDKQMNFYRYKEGDLLVESKLKIPEPKPQFKLIPDNQTLVILPGAVFSKYNERIGYGGGFYDRFLAVNACCKTLAVAYSFQIVDKLPVLSYDIKPQIIITELEEYRC